LSIQYSRKIRVSVHGGRGSEISGDFTTGFSIPEAPGTTVVFSCSMTTEPCELLQIRFSHAKAKKDNKCS